MSDERRADIEAAYMRGYRAALAGLKPLPGGEDRVRDARGDDEVKIIERDAPLLEVVRGPYAKALARIAELEAQLEVARSSQGEDHEAREGVEFQEEIGPAARQRPGPGTQEGRS